MCNAASKAINKKLLSYIVVAITTQQQNHESYRYHLCHQTTQYQCDHLDATSRLAYETKGVAGTKLHSFTNTAHTKQCFHSPCRT